MQRRLGPTRLAALVAAFAFSLALTPSSALASHVQCGDEIAGDTTLDSDLNCTGDGLTVTNANVTVDLNGHTIRGSGTGAGVWVVSVLAVEQPNDVVVRDGKITGFRDGIVAEDASRMTVQGMVLERNNIGFLCTYAGGCRIEDSLVRWNARGVGMLAADASYPDAGVVRNNRFVGNGIATGTQGSAPGPALQVSGYRATVTGNRVVRNLRQGMRIDDYPSGGEVTVSRNVIAQNGEDGIEVEYLVVTTISGNRIADNGGNGVSLVYVHGTRVHDNRISGNAGDGVLAGSQVEALIDGNRTHRNGDDGIDVDLSSECCSDVTVRANRAFSNSDLGIEAATGTTDGGGNKAKRNGNPAQCVGVVCK